MQWDFQRDDQNQHRSRHKDVARREEKSNVDFASDAAKHVINRLVNHYKQLNHLELTSERVVGKGVEEEEQEVKEPEQVEVGGCDEQKNNGACYPV